MPGSQGRIAEVHVDETTFRSGTIEALDASIAGFVGPAPSGPVDRAQALTSVAEFSQVYGGGPLVAVRRRSRDAALPLARRSGVL